MVVWKRCLRVLCFFREDCQKKKTNTKSPKKTLIQTENWLTSWEKGFIFLVILTKGESGQSSHYSDSSSEKMRQSSWLNCPFFFLIIIIMTRLYFLFLFAFVKRLRMCLNICIYDKYLYLCIVAHNVKLIVYMIVLFLWPHHTLYMVVL